MAVDLRGHGRGAPADLSTTSMADYAEDVRAVVRTLASPPIVLGWSMGGLVAMAVRYTFTLIAVRPSSAAKLVVHCSGSVSIAR